MRSVWSGVLHFGRIPVPIALVPARRDGDVSLRKLHRECSTPVEQTTVCPLHGEIPDEEIVKGWEVAPGQFVLVEDAELEAILPEEGRDIEALAYVTASAIESRFVTRSYFLRPAKELVGKRAYALVADALNLAGAAIITRHVARKKEHFSAIAAVDRQLLLMHTLALAEDLADPEPIRVSLAGVDVDDTESELARTLIDRYVGAFNPSLLTGSQRQRVRELLEGKIAADEIVVPITVGAEVPKVGSGSGSVDLADALRTSIREAPRARKRKAAAARA